MDKLLGQEIPSGVARVRFLKDNCDSVEQIGYMKQFSPEQVVAMKDDLAEVSIKINDIENAKKEMTKEFNEQLKPLAEEKATLLDNIKKKAEFTNETCYKFVYHEERMVAYYNAEGELVSQRTAHPDEAQLTIRMTGTDN